MRKGYTLQVFALVYITFIRSNVSIAFYRGIRKLASDNISPSDFHPPIRSNYRVSAYYYQTTSILKRPSIKASRVVNMSKPFYCYLLRSLNPHYKNQTYGGSTNDLKRRIRQHNGEIAGGAKTTKGKGPWQYYVLLEGFSTYNEALSCEWRIKHPTNSKRRPKKYSGVEGRVLSMNLVLNTTTWTAQSLGLNSSRPYTLHIDNDMSRLLDHSSLAVNVKVVDIATVLSDFEAA